MFLTGMYSLVVLAVFAPEAVTVLAISEYFNVAKFNELISKDEDAWSIEHSWIAHTDGWKSSNNIPRRTNRKSLSQREILWLFSKRLVDVSSLPTKEEILDRSKANGLVKVLACVQSSWLVVQVSTHSFIYETSQSALRD